MSRSKRAFSLYEMLVCCAIVAVIASMAFSAFTSAKFSAKKTVSISNLKQLHAAFMLYEADWGDYPCVVGIARSDGSGYHNPYYECLIKDYLGGANPSAPILDPNSAFSSNSYFRGYIVRGGFKMQWSTPEYVAAQACREKRGGEDPLVFDPNRQSTKVGSQEGQRYWLVVREQGNVEKIPFRKYFHTRRRPASWPCPAARDIDNL